MDPLTTAAMVKAGSNIVASLFGGEETQRHKYKSRVKDRSESIQKPVYDFKKMRKKAEKAGLNPLTVLRAIGPAAVGSRTRNSGYVLNKTKESWSGGGDPVGDAIRGVGDLGAAYASYDPLDQKMKQATYDGMVVQNQLGRQALTWAGVPAYSTGGGGAFAGASEGVLNRPLFTNYIGADGSETRIALGPEWDEVATGAIISTFQTIDKQFGVYADQLKESIAKDDAAGAGKHPGTLDFWFGNFSLPKAGTPYVPPVTTTPGAVPRLTPGMFDTRVGNF